MGQWLDRVRAAEALLAAERAASADEEGRARLDAVEGLLLAAQARLWESGEERLYALSASLPSGRARHTIAATSSSDAERLASRWALSLATAYGLRAFRVRLDGEDGYSTVLTFTY